MERLEQSDTEGELIGPRIGAFASVLLRRHVAGRARAPELGGHRLPLASGHLLPEMNHNEIVGWEVQKEIYPMARVVMMEDLEEGERTSIRVGITARLIEATGASVRRVSAGGEHLLERLMSLIILGDYTSVYLGSAWGVDPTPVEKIDHLKSKLAEAEQ